MDKNYILYEKVVKPIQLPTYTKSIKIIICCLIIIFVLYLLQNFFNVDWLNKLFNVIKRITSWIIIVMIGLGTAV